MKINEHSLYLIKVKVERQNQQTTEPRKEVDTLLVYPKTQKFSPSHSVSLKWLMTRAMSLTTTMCQHYAYRGRGLLMFIATILSKRLRNKIRPGG